MILLEFPKVSWLLLIQKQFKISSNSLVIRKRIFLGGVAMFLSFNMIKSDQLVYPIRKQLFKVNKKVLINIYKHYFCFSVVDCDKYLSNA